MTMSAAPDVLWRHPQVSEADLNEYLADAIRPPAWDDLPDRLAAALRRRTEAGPRLSGVWYRGRAKADPEPALIRSWANDPNEASQFGRYVTGVSGSSIQPIAVVSHGSWLEVVGWLR